jgi:hypothetical protein
VRLLRVQLLTVRSLKGMSETASDLQGEPRAIFSLPGEPGACPERLPGRGSRPRVAVIGKGDALNVRDPGYVLRGLLLAMSAERPGLSMSEIVRALIVEEYRRMRDRAEGRVVELQALLESGELDKGR